MGLLQKILGGSKTKRGIYEFSVTEIHAVGDSYRYEVEGESREEAFEKLVKWFYGKETGGLEAQIKSKSGTVRQPQKDVFWVSGMPRWFAQCISGHIGVQHREKLAAYMKERNIEPSER